MSKSKMNLGLAAGVLGVLVLMGVDTYAAEPGRKVVDCEGYASLKGSVLSCSQRTSSQRKVAQPAPQRAGFFRSVSGMQAETEVAEYSRRGTGLASPKGPVKTQPSASAGRNREIDLESRAWGSEPWTLFSPERRSASHGGFVAEPARPAATEGVTTAVEPLERESASANPPAASPAAARDGNTIYVSTQWVPAISRDELHDISEIQQVDVNKAMQKLDRAQ